MKQHPTKKLLITGASGFLGWNTCQAATADWQVYGTYQSNDVTIEGVTMLKTDLTDYEAVRSLIQELAPDAIIHTAAQARPHICHENPESTYAINVTVPTTIAGLCADAAIPCVFTSTDFVFDGLHPPYSETAPVSPINHYGEQKVEAEVRMLDRHPASVVCRMPLMFGYADSAPSFLQGFLNRLRSGDDLKLFTDEIRTPVSGRDAAKGLLMALESAHGILHLGGKERLSRYQFGHLMVEAFGLDTVVIQGCHQADVPLDMPRPLDVSMDSSRAYVLGYAPGLVLSELKALREKV
ncbi:MAG: NAD(P)-dependent oxidoreductase [Leptolyngbyaceae bacterium]|nr:NAD(P)-dependent oxidoreductase [Leptolyngbyaceae bacterium]